MRICRGLPTSHCTPPPNCQCEQVRAILLLCILLCGGRGTVSQHLWEHNHSFIFVSRSLQRKGDRRDKRQEAPAILSGGWELDESSGREGRVQRGVIRHFAKATACSDVWAVFFFFFHLEKLGLRETEKSKQKWEPLSCLALCWPFESHIFVCSTHTGRLSCGARADWTGADLAALHLDVSTDGEGSEM